MAAASSWETQLSDILNLLQKYNIPINESQTTTLRNFIEKHHDDRDKFISQILTARYDINKSPVIGQLSPDMLDVILYRFIKITDLNTTNIVSVASVIIDDFNKAEEVDIDEVCDVLMHNDVCGRTFVRGTAEYINAAKFCTLFKSVSNWRKNRSVFRKMWVRINKWEEIEIQGFENRSGSNDEVTKSLGDTKKVCQVSGMSRKMSPILRNM